MLKTNLIFVLFLWMVLSCLRFSGSGEKFVPPKEIAQQKSDSIMTAFMNHDKEAFKELLCPGLQEEHPDLDREMEELFAFVEGDIISYDLDYPTARGGSTTELGWVKQFITTKIIDIQTSSGKSYNIHYTFNTIYKGHPEQLGITYICIYKSDAPHDPVTGYPPGESYLIEFKGRL